MAPHFRLHLVDLSGYGRSQGYGAISLQQMAEVLLAAAPERVSRPITVASSPCFTAQESCAGIRPEVLSGFQQQLSQDFKRTVGRFPALQTLGSESARPDARQLKTVGLNQPMPSVEVLEVLNGGMEMVRTVPALFDDLWPTVAKLFFGCDPKSRPRAFHFSSRRIYLCY